MKLLILIALLLIPVVAMAEFTGALVMTGTLADAKGASGATWTYSGTDDAVVYSLYGRIWVPNTAGGTYPAVIHNHGYLGDADAISDTTTLMRTNFGTGMIVIGTTLTHSCLSLPCETGENGQAECPDGQCRPYNAGGGDAGCSTENYQRVRKVYDVLTNFSSEAGGWSAFTVDTNRVAIHGHSAGAYLTTCMVDNGQYPTLFKVASHTGGGYDSGFGTNFTPTAAECDTITVPYSLNHGGADATVPPEWDTALAAILDGAYELNIMAGTDCDSHAESKNCDTTMTNIEAWYTTYGMFDTSTCTGVSLTGATIQ